MVYLKTNQTNIKNHYLGATKNCGRYYQVQSGDICQLVALNNTISISLFEAINPSINADCTNLVPGLYYCVLPTGGWNITGNAVPVTTTVSAPAPTTSGECLTYLSLSGSRHIELDQTINAE